MHQWKADGIKTIPPFGIGVVAGFSSSLNAILNLTAKMEQEYAHERVEQQYNTVLTRQLARHLLLFSHGVNG
jgi:phage terminase large subunit